MAGDRSLLSALLTVGLSSALFYAIMRLLLKQMDPHDEKKAKAAIMGQKLLQRLQIKGLKLTEYENIIASNVVDPSDIKTTFSDVGGLPGVISMLKEEIVMPFNNPDLYQSMSKLIQPPKGILLFGPPGCGKTLVARALAKECGCCFINLKVDAFMDKWYGESQKLIAALFSLARKLEPTIIFIDEVDSFLRSRDSMDTESSAMVKGQFMSLWDGFETDDSRIVIVAATNRPDDIDQAIRRRLTRTCRVTLPSSEQRSSILKVILKTEKMDEDISFPALAALTSGYSGSDLRELCRLAAMSAVRRCADAAQATDPIICMSDFAHARQAVEHSITT